MILSTSKCDSKNQRTSLVSLLLIMLQIPLPLAAQETDPHLHEAIPLPAWESLPSHDSQGLALASTKYNGMLSPLKPTLAESEKLCTHLNPQHSILATGALNAFISDHLAYASRDTRDSGFGPGLNLTSLHTAQIVSDRVFLFSGKQLMQMLSLESYRGNWPYWPAKKPMVAAESNGRLVVASSRYEYSVYQKTDSGSVYFLIARKAPNHAFRYSYGTNGLSRIFSDNPCDETQDYSYTDGKLTKISVLESSGAGKETEFSYNSLGHLSEIRTKLLKAPQLGSLPVSFHQSIGWRNGKIIEVKDHTKNETTSYVYDSDKLKSVALASGGLDPLSPVMSTYLQLQ